MYACVATAEPVIVTTVVNKTPGTTNIVEIPNGQAARLSLVRDFLDVQKDGVTFFMFQGEVVQGPAVFHLVCRDDPAIMTLERWTVRKAVVPKP